jgi:hypothetical protein
VGHLVAQILPIPLGSTLRLELAAGCPKIAANKITDLCGVYYPDRVPYSQP